MHNKGDQTSSHEKERKKQIESLENRTKFLEYGFCAFCTCASIAFLILLILSILGFFFPGNNNANMCPNEICNSLTKGLSSAASMEDWNKLERRISQTGDYYTFLNNSMNSQLTSVNHLQSQIDNIQEGRCACNLSHFCMKSQCESIEKKLEERVIGVCEEEKPLTSVGVEINSDCSEYRIINPGFYHITAEISVANTVLSVHIDDVIVFSEISGHISIFEPLIKGDRLRFSVNGTKATASYSSLFLVSGSTPIEYLTKHRMRKDKLYSITLSQLKNIGKSSAGGWFEFISWFILRTSIAVLTLAILGLLGFYLVTVAFPKIKQWNETRGGK